MIHENLQRERIQKGYNKLLCETKKLIQKFDLNTPLAYPETGYFLPTIYGFLDEKIVNIEQLKKLLKKIEKEGGDKRTKGETELGLLSLILIEIIEILKYTQQQNQSRIYTGFIPDAIFRKLGVPLVDGSILGLGIILGERERDEEAGTLIQEFQKRNILTLTVGRISRQLLETNIQVGLGRLIVPLGEELTSLTHAVNLAVRMALSFGGVKPKDREALLHYLGEKIPIFILVLNSQDDCSYTLTSALASSGIPIITNYNEKRKEELFNGGQAELVEHCLTTRGIKPRIEEVHIPISYSFSFEGQGVRKQETFVEFGGGRTLAFEFLRTKPLEEVQDGQILVTGPEITEIKEGIALPLALIIEVAGRKMHEEFEPVLERQIHHFINFGDGLWHNAQRDIIWLRISKEAVRKGFRIKHLGDILYTKLHSEFSEIVDKVQIKIYTEMAMVEQCLSEAKQQYLKRDNRMRNLTDDSVEIFYSCLLCQSFAPHHVCIISPERTGLCGAVNWLDAKTSCEINPKGGIQPVIIGKSLDSKFGCWEGVNKYVLKESHGTITDICLYSIMTKPLTSCGCFECIAAVIPETNGVMIVTREHIGTTPLGLSFTTLAGTIGGGTQTSGFIGIGKNYIVSKKFLLAEGGIKRIVWMPKEFKLQLCERIETLEPGLTEKIADEEIALTLEELVNFLTKVNHPTLRMEPII